MMSRAIGRAQIKRMFLTFMSVTICWNKPPNALHSRSIVASMFFRFFQRFGLNPTRWYGTDALRGGRDEFTPRRRRDGRWRKRYTAASGNVRCGPSFLTARERETETRAHTHRHRQKGGRNRDGRGKIRQENDSNETWTRPRRGSRRRRESRLYQRMRRVNLTNLIFALATLCKQHNTRQRDGQRRDARRPARRDCQRTDGRTIELARSLRARICFLRTAPRWIVALCVVTSF